ncbi:potassium channel family protein [Desulfobacterota bacterium M19]
MTKITQGVMAFFLILLFGTLGYMIIAGANFMDSLYMTVITITTVGFHEVMPLGTGGRVFTMLLILIGVGFVFYVFGKFTETIVEGGLHKALGKINMDKRLAKVRDHYVICGYGRIGKIICQSFYEAGQDFVIIENDPEEIVNIIKKRYLVVEGEASDDETLLKAGIRQAKGLVSVVSSDADNVYITLSAKEMNPDLLVLSRASGREGAETKLRRAGADKVISPYDIGGRHMANMILRPMVDAFIDLTVHADNLGLLLEEIRIPESAPFINQTLADSGLRRDYDIIVVAIKRHKDGKMLFNPQHLSVIRAEDIIIVLGEVDNIRRLEKDM